MSYTEDSNDLDWNDSKRKVRASKKETGGSNVSRAKYSQKFCQKWMELFHPWLTRCAEDADKPFCRACQTRLDCNRCHLQRHERTVKHQRNLEILINKGEGAARQNLCIRQERSKYYQQRIKQDSSVASNQDMSENGMDTLDDDYIEEPDGGDADVDADADGHGDEFQFVQTEAAADLYNEAQETNLQQFKQEVDFKSTTVTASTPKILTSVNARPAAMQNTLQRKVPTKKDRMKLLMQIQKDKSELMESFKDLLLPSPPKENNHVDLFFESVSSSVKALTPKLIAETKMRVSQLICEMELRALTEQDATVGSANAVVVSTDSNNSYIVHETHT